jgi:hypothetical protein
MVINPRRKRHRRRTRRASSSRKHRRRARRRRLFVAVNPRRRRRSHRRRSHARRRRHTLNPRFGLSGITSGLKTGLGIGIGVVATEVGTSFILSKVPGVPAALQAGPGRLVSKAVIGGLVLPQIAKMVRQPALARNIAIGAWVSIATDILNAYVVPALHLSEYSMGEYSHQLGDDYSGNFSLSGEGSPEEVGGGENMYADTMY